MVRAARLGRPSKMDETRKLLDSLMGQNRDINLEEAKKMEGKNFTADKVCKPYLLGFCPQHELSNSKLVTKRNLGECKKVHSDAMRKEYQGHPEREQFRAKYEAQFLPFLESQIREADAWVTRERANVQKAASGEKTTLSSMPDSVKAQVATLTADMNKMMASAEEMAEKGDIEGSQFKVTLAEEMKNKIKELEDEHPNYTVTLREEWVCDVCGTRTEAVTEHNTTRFAAHFTGKVHLGYAKIREWVKNIRKNMREGDKVHMAKTERERDDRRRGHRSVSRGKEHKESAGGNSKKRSPSRERERERERRKRSRSRSRRGGRGGDDGKRRRSRSRSRRRR